MTVLAIGGTGQVGRRVVERLVADGLAVRAMTRDPAGARLPAEVEVVRGDALGIGALREALEGVRVLFLLNPVSADETMRTLLPLALAGDAGVAGIVFLSMVNADVLPDVPHAVAKWAGERLVAERGLPATVLRANYFMQNDAAQREALSGPGVYGMPIGEVGAAMIDVRDLAEVAALEVERRYRGTGDAAAVRLDVSGPEVIGAAAAAAAWSAALGRPVRAGDGDLEAFETRLAGMVPDAIAYDLVLMFRAWQRIGVLPAPDGTARLEAMLGRRLRRYGDFAAECAAAWREGA